MLYHNLIWDFDGTLFDSYPHIQGAYLQALADFGRTTDPDILMAKLKINFGEAHKYIEPSDELRARFTQYEHDIDFAPKAVLYDGMKELLADTRAAGVRHFLFTHRNNLALTYMERAGILGCFDGWVTSDDKEHFALKPSPASILYLLEHYGIDFVIKKACSRVDAEAKALGLEDAFTLDWREVVTDPEIDIVIELIGGEHRHRLTHNRGDYGLRPLHLSLGRAVGDTHHGGRIRNLQRGLGLYGLRFIGCGFLLGLRDRHRGIGDHRLGGLDLLTQHRLDRAGVHLIHRQQRIAVFGDLPITSIT